MGAGAGATFFTVTASIATTRASAHRNRIRKMEDILSLLIPIVLAVCVVVAIRIIEDSRVRRRLAETHATEELVRALMQSDEQNRRGAALKWGIVLVAIGLAFGVIGLFGLDAEDPASYGLLFGATGLGMLGFRALK